MNKLKKIIKLLTILVVCISITGCAKDYVKYKSYSEDEAKIIVSNELKEKYPFIDYNITYLEKKELEVCVFWLDGCTYGPVKGAYEYIFTVEDDNRQYEVSFKEPYRNKRENKVYEYKIDMHNLENKENSYIIYKKINEYNSFQYSFNEDSYGNIDGIIYTTNISELKEFLEFLDNNKDVLRWNFVITNDINIYNQLLDNRDQYENYISYYHITHYLKYYKINGLYLDIFENGPNNTQIINYEHDKLSCEDICRFIISIE